MTPTAELLTSQEQLEYLGMETDTLKRVVVPIKLLNSTLDFKNTDIEYFKTLIEKSLSNHISPLDQCLCKLQLSFLDDSFDVLLEEDKPDIAIAVLHDTLMMKLFPPRNLYTEQKSLKLPVFEIEYVADNVPILMKKDSIIQSILQTKNMFEGEFLLELLNKAVRSQRNKIEKPFNSSSISEALELIERENCKVDNILMNTKAYSIIRHEISPETETYRNINSINFSPSGRMNKNRVYFMGESTILGVIAKTQFNVNIEIIEDKYNISCLLRIGSAILNRNIISIIEH